MPESTTAPLKRTRLPAAQRRAGILKAARKVFLKNGLAGARTKAIADLAGTSEAILYRHFASKEELFEAAILEPLENLIESMTASAMSMGQLSGRASRTEASYVINAEIIERMREIGPLLGIALFSDRDSGRRFYRARLEPLFNRLTEAMAESLEDWKHKPISPEMVIAMQLGVFNWVAMQEHFGSRKPDGDSVSHQLTDVFVRAL